MLQQAYAKKIFKWVPIQEFHPFNMNNKDVGDKVISL